MTKKIGSAAVKGPPRSVAKHVSVGRKRHKGERSSVQPAKAKPSPIVRAFLKRATKALRSIAESADEASLEDAITAPTDAGTVARAVSAAAASADAIAQLDPLAALIARGAEQKMDLLRQCGGTLSVNEAAQLLGISRQAVDKRRRQTKLLAVPRGADYAYPACQFEDGEVLPGLPDVLTHLGQHAWTALAFLATPHDALGQRTPIAVLKGRDPQAKQLTLRLARIAAGDGFG